MECFEQRARVHCEHCTVQISVAVALIQMKSLKVEVGKVSAPTLFARGLGGPKRYFRRFSACLERESDSNFRANINVLFGNRNSLIMWCTE